MLEDLEKNIEQEKRIINKLKSIEESLESSGERDEHFLKTRESLLNQLRILNRAVPNLLRAASGFNFGSEKNAIPVGGGSFKIDESKIKKKLARFKKKSKGGVLRNKSSVARMSYVLPSEKEKKNIAIEKKDKKHFLKNLRDSETGLNKMKKAGESRTEILRKPSFIAGISNKLFRSHAEKISPKFSGLTKDLKKANVHFLTSTYVSLALFFGFLSFIFGLVVFGVLLIFSLGNWIYFWIPFVLTGFCFAGFYFYPSSECVRIQKKISQELPFAAIHMAAIAGSDIEPTKIFKIIAMSKEYQNVGKEIRKVINQTDIYGYDLVTSLKNVSKRTSNKKLAELFNGLATNISSGGELKNYLEKKAENYLLDYKLERRRYSDLAGTFMDIYISILIAAPLVLMMMFIIMNVAGLGLAGLTISTLLGLSIGAVVLINIIFLLILNWKQPNV